MPKKSEVQVVYPGVEIPIDTAIKTRVGQGLVQDQTRVLSTKCGVLSSEKGSNSTRLWVQNSQKLYIPTVEELVLGTVIEKHSENYRVEIGGTQPAQLPALSFEGATKRNKPNINVGALVYCRVAAANQHMETELSCTSPHFKKDWVTGESLFGELTGGYAFDCSLDLARRLMSEDAYVLECLGKHVPFELAVGVNGKVWVNSGHPVHSILISNAILNSQHMEQHLIKAMVERLVSSIN